MTGADSMLPRRAMRRRSHRSAQARLPPSRGVAARSSIARSATASLARSTFSVRAWGLLAQVFVAGGAAHARPRGVVVVLPPLGPRALALPPQSGRAFAPPALLRPAPPEAARPGGLL